MDALAVWCRRWLGAPPMAELFEAGYLSTVKGLRLADGREVVVKMRPRRSRLAGCTVVHRALWTAGFLCPEPLVGFPPLDGYAATAETLVLDAGKPPSTSELARLSAAALARLVKLAPGPGSLPSLVPSPSWDGWDHTEPGLWPAPASNLKSHRPAGFSHVGKKTATLRFTYCDPRTARSASCSCRLYSARR
jgi:hypothetical protein